MFVNAIKRVTPFTQAFIFSLRRFDGSFGSGCATFIVLNEEGWILTTAHSFREYMQFHQHDKAKWEAFKAKRRIIESGIQVSFEDAQAELKVLEPDPGCITHYSWITSLPTPKDASISPLFLFEAVDLAVGKINSFDGSTISSYPVFKNPTEELTIGSPLCCVGFANAHMPTQFMPETELFDMPRVMLWHYPTTGILTRLVTDRVPPHEGLVTRMEISAPILPGQSGGPIVDDTGLIWGIAQRMAFEDLDFDALKRDEGGGLVRVPQFQNVGQAAPVGDVVSILTSQEVSFQIS